MWGPALFQFSFDRDSRSKGPPIIPELRGAVGPATRNGFRLPPHGVAREALMSSGHPSSLVGASEKDKVDNNTLNILDS